MSDTHQTIHLLRIYTLQSLRLLNQDEFTKLNVSKQIHIFITSQKVPKTICLIIDPKVFHLVTILQVRIDSSQFGQNSH
jgi:hypothetical protein